MTRDRLTIRAGLAGLACAAVNLLALPLAGHGADVPPAWRLHTGGVQAWYDINRDDLSVEVASSTVAAVLCVWFTAGLARYLFVGGRGTGPPARAVVAVAIVMSGMVIVLGGIYGVAPVHGWLAYDIAVLIGIPGSLSLFLLGVEAARNRLATRQLPHWIWWPTLGITAMSLLASGSLLAGIRWTAAYQMVTVAVFIAVNLWIEVLSIQLVRAPDDAADAVDLDALDPTGERADRPVRMPWRWRHQPTSPQL